MSRPPSPNILLCLAHFAEMTDQEVLDALRPVLPIQPLAGLCTGYAGFGFMEYEKSMLQLLWVREDYWNLAPELAASKNPYVATLRSELDKRLPGVYFYSQVRWLQEVGAGTPCMRIHCWSADTISCNCGDPVLFTSPEDEDHE